MNQKSLDYLPISVFGKTFSCSFYLLIGSRLNMRFIYHWNSALCRMSLCCIQFFWKRERILSLFLSLSFFLLLSIFAFSHLSLSVIFWMILIPLKKKKKKKDGIIFFFFPFSIPLLHQLVDFWWYPYVYVPNSRSSHTSPFPWNHRITRYQCSRFAIISGLPDLSWVNRKTDVGEAGKTAYSVLFPVLNLFAYTNSPYESIRVALYI